MIDEFAVLCDKIGRIIQDFRNTRAKGRAELQEFIGLDYSMHDLYVTSEGERANYPRFLRRKERNYLHKKSYELAQDYDAAKRIQKSKILR